MTNLGDKVNPNRDEDKDKVLPQDTPPPLIPVNSPISREEHLASLDALKSSMRSEMVVIFEQYLGKKSLDPPTQAPHLVWISP
jgi:hypothetical protein